MKKILWLASKVSLCFSLLACSTYHLQIRETLTLVSQGQYERAAELVKPLAFTPGRDQLAYLLEYATIQQLAGNYDQSNQAYNLADRMSEVKDYVSISDQAASLAFSESMVAYQGDDFEKMLINIFSALNFAAQNNFESGLVEVKRLNEKLNKYRSDAGRDYADNPFAYYLSGVLWEKQSQYDSACIDYQKFYELTTDKQNVKEDLLYCSYKAQRFSQLRKVKKEFGVSSYGKTEVRAREKMVDLMVVIHHGLGPIKRPNPAWHRLPILSPRANYIQGLELAVKNRGDQEASSTHSSWEAVSIEKLGVSALQKQYAGLIAKRIAARIVKKELAKEIEKNHEGLGLVAAIAMDIADQADLRQWATLPQSVHVIRFRLPVGRYDLHFKSKQFSGEFREVKTLPIDLDKPEFELIVMKVEI